MRLEFSESPEYRLTAQSLKDVGTMLASETHAHAVALVPDVDDTLESRNMAADYAARLAIAESLAELDAGRARAYAEALEY